MCGLLSGDVKGMLLLDAFPNNLSIATQDGELTILIAKNTSTPTIKSKIFTTTEDNQTEISISIYEGEGVRADQDIYVGRVTLLDIPRARRGVPQIEVKLDIDANHVVRAFAKNLATGRDAVALLQAPFQLNDTQVNVMSRKVAHELTKVKERLAQ
jgi:molecular chaperone DnaK